MILIMTQTDPLTTTITAPIKKKLDENKQTRSHLFTRFNPESYRVQHFHDSEFYQIEKGQVEGVDYFIVATKDVPDAYIK